MILVDTNILLRIADGANPDSAHARNAVLKLHRAGRTLHMVPQNLYEFWAVATRPTGAFSSANGLGMSPSRADLWLGYLYRNFVLLPDKPELSEQWRNLVTIFGVTGKKSHDVRLVAAMKTHNVADLLTFNIQDFKKFASITVINPRTV